MKIGIIGLPNSGKTTVFNALTRGQAETTSFAGGRFEVHTAVVNVPDPRLDWLHGHLKVPRKVPAQVTYNDIAGLERGAGERGFSGALLNAISANDALLLVVRAFENSDVPHLEGSVDPVRDWQAVETELVLNDLLAVERRLERIAEELRKQNLPRTRRAELEEEQSFMERLRAHLEAGRPLRALDLSPDEEKGIRHFAFLSLKPLLVVVNLGDEQPEPDLSAFEVGPRAAVTSLRGRLEAELAVMNPEEAAEFMEAYGLKELSLSRVIRMSYDLLGLKTFFTFNEKEVRAWTVPREATAVEAAGAIHSDMARGFIRAEVIHVDDLRAAGSMVEARKRGLVRLEGKEYIVRDGDILTIRFST